MGESRFYLAIGEEASRGTAETTTVGFVPLLSGRLPSVEFDEAPVSEFRGESSLLGPAAWVRKRRSWQATLELPFYTEAGGETRMMGTFLKHLFGKAVSLQKGLTAAYGHMLYPSARMYEEGSGELENRALTLNYNLNEGETLRNYPYVGGRVVSVGFEQTPGEPLKLTAELTGQFRDTPSVALQSPVFPSDGLRCDYTTLRLYTGSVLREGTAPDFTDITPDTTATRIKPDRLSIKIDSGKEDVLRLSGLDYPDRTRLGRFTVEVELTLDWEDPQTGFSSVDEFNGWLSGTETTNLLCVWDTGTEAATGYNHKLVVDIPRLVRVGGEPEYTHEKEPTITLKYQALYDDTVGYTIGCLLQNTAQSL